MKKSGISQAKSLFWIIQKRLKFYFHRRHEQKGGTAARGVLFTFEKEKPYETTIYDRSNAANAAVP